jgi:hypothetical protein
MKNFLKLLGVIALAVVIGFSMVACDFGNNDDSDGNENGNENGGNGGGNNNPIQLVYNTWADGVILTSSGRGQQWFKFTATENSQYIHVSFGTLTDLYVQLCDIKSKIIECNIT